MKISDLDANFTFQRVDVPDIVWHDAKDKSFSLYGVYYEAEEKRYRRMPDAIAEQVSIGVRSLATHTAGGQVRFATDSDYILLKALLPQGVSMSHMPIFGQFGFSIYEDNAYIGTIAPTSATVAEGKDFVFEASLQTRRKKGDTDRRMHEYIVYFPLYSGVKELFIGLQETAHIAPAPFPRQGQTVLFYGSSITQGGCASHPGNDFVNRLSRLCGAPVQNLGFSGNGKAEDPMIDYLCAQTPSVFVLDYDHNAPTPEYLLATHEKLFRAFRASHPHTPVILISQPDFDYRPQSDIRRDIIRRTYENALRDGDKKVFFIDGETLFGKEGRDACTVDLCHPNDLGFYRMASTIYPVLKNCLEQA